jgi:hypothetical protein
VRLSRPRVLLRALLLAVGGGFMLWRAWGSWRSAEALAGGDAALASRLAVVFALMGLLALLAAGVALSSLRPRRQGRSLHLGGSLPRPAAPDGEARESPGADEAPTVRRPP